MIPDDCPRSSPQLTWQKKVAFALMTTLVFFISVEILLTSIGYRPSTDLADPLVGFSGRVPLFESKQRSDGSAHLRTAAAKRVWFNEQDFAAIKPEGTRRIFCLGGSTTYGRPFSDPTSYCGWLRELLPLSSDSTSSDSTRWEVINAGGISYASYRVAAVMEELVDYQPDLFLVYTAHNEFLERRTYANLLETSPLRRDFSAVFQSTRTGSLIQRLISRPEYTATPTVELLPAEVDEMLNHSMGPKDYHRDDRWRDSVLKHYRINLERMVSIARRSGAEIVFITPASNLRDCWPFKTEFPIESESVTRDRLQAVFMMIDNGHFADALTALEPILADDPRNAETHFYTGKALFGLERYNDAEEAFERAIDEDVCPLRATSAITRTIQDVAKTHQVKLVDFKQHLQRHCKQELGHRCFGREHFLDHVHPTVDVHRELAIWILETLKEMNLGVDRMPSEPQKQLVQARVESRIDTTTEGLAFRNLAKVMHWAGKYHEAGNHACDALKRIPGDLESQYLVADCLLCSGQRDLALPEYAKLFALGEWPKAYLPYGELLLDSGQLASAKAYLIQATLDGDQQRRDRALYALAIAHQGLEEFELAAESLGQLSEASRDADATLLLKAEALMGQGQTEQATDTLVRLTQLHPDLCEGHYRLGIAFIAKQEFAEAKKQLKIARSLDSSDPRIESALTVVNAAGN